MAKAKRLLEQGEAIGKIALDCGFSDQSHFTNYFKSFIGITPKQYQRIFTQKRSDLDE
ncbi:helix-turn-helix domain-containing protein [Thomasclavelia ramosa]|uniref:helix-turn-helix domain-containing protein n=1 Tax=Thomasclavelia ramosa TaxID=1547 RepID=UPI003FA3CF28